jgi:hypothetical protein
VTGHDDLTYPDMRPDTGADAWAQIGRPCAVDEIGNESYGVRGIDGREYVLEGFGGAWRIVRRGSYGLGAVVRSDTPKGAVQRLNAFHVGETCIHCQHVHPSRGHFCDVCGRRRYA